MSPTITTDIFCEVCSCWDSGCSVSGTNKIEVRFARRKAKARGWIYISEITSGRMIDLCPDCATKHRASA